MQKTTNISLGGQIFRIDNEACLLLKHYLDHVSAKFSNEPDAEETLNDIETRIAEIFGGGQEPPVLISEEMIKNMISIMGAPEEYYDDPDPSVDNTQPSKLADMNRKEMYDPNSPSAATGKALSSFFKAIGNFFSSAFRFIAIVIGFLFTLFGVLFLTTIITLALFSDSAILTPMMINLPQTLTLVLGTEEIGRYIVMSSIVILLPLLALIYLGIKIMFRIDIIPKVASISMFVIWIVTSCSLGIALASNLSIYGSNGRSVDYIEIETPPDTLYIKSERSLTPMDYKYSSIDQFQLWEDEQNNRIFGNVSFRVRGRDEGHKISVTKGAYSIVKSDAIKIASELEYGIRLSEDTLYIDECFVQPGSRWMGSNVDVAIYLPIGTVIKPVEGYDFSMLGYFDPYPDSPFLWVVESGLSAKNTPSGPYSGDNGANSEDPIFGETAYTDQQREETVTSSELNASEKEVPSVQLGISAEN